MKGYSVKLPLRNDEADGVFLMNKNMKEVINQNFRMLLLTNPGEKIMNTDYGIGAKKLLFENKLEGGLTEVDLESVIIEQVSKYMPYLILERIKIEDYDYNTNGVFIEVKYRVPSLDAEDTLALILKQI